MPTRAGAAAAPWGATSGVEVCGAAAGDTGRVAAGGAACGAGWIVVRGCCHGGIGEEQAASPMASANVDITAASRPCLANSTKQTARSMHFLPKWSLVESTRRACTARHAAHHA
jgi:hypothetical protein